MKKLALLAIACILAQALAPVALGEGERIALICEPAGGDAFLTQALEKAGELKDVFGYELSVLECGDVAAWTAGYAAALEAGCELIIGIGRQAAPCAAFAAEEHPDAAAFAVIDADADSERVASYTYSVEQAAYVVGVMAAAAFPGETRFGYVGGMEDAADFRCRWGFAEGVRSLRPEARFALAYTGSCADAEAARTLALELRDKGCAFAFGGAGAGNAGLFEAALALAEAGAPLYVTGQDADMTREDNPCILASALKQAGVTMAIVIDNFYAGTLEPGLTVLDMASGTVGVSNVTAAGAWRNEDVLTDEVVEACRAVADRIADGELALELPADAAAYEIPAL